MSLIMNLLGVRTEKNLYICFRADFCYHGAGKERDEHSIAQRCGLGFLGLCFSGYVFYPKGMDCEGQVW